jgi:hypothetical protein
MLLLGRQVTRHGNTQSLLCRHIARHWNQQANACEQCKKNAPNLGFVKIAAAHSSFITNVLICANIMLQNRQKATEKSTQLPVDRKRLLV